MATKTEKPQLPRILAVIFSNLELMRKIRHDPYRHLRHIILDFVHAFFNFPGLMEERRFFMARLRRHILHGSV